MKPPAFVDIHCHLLPEIDDGADCWDETFAMAQMAVADGIKTITATPHQLGNFSQNTGDDIRALVAETQQRLVSAGIDLELLPGADVRIEPSMIAKIQTGEVLSLADRKRHVLLELPHELYFPLDSVLSQLASHGMQGILSHPERNQGLLARPDLVGPLVDGGCLMQVTAGSLMGTFGPRTKQFAESLVTSGMTHFIATDVHGAKRRRPLIQRAYRRVCELRGETDAQRICCEYPAMVAAGQPVPTGRLNRPGRKQPARSVA